MTAIDAALLIVGHGSTVNPDSSAPTLAHAAEIRRRESFRGVACCFWKEEPSLRDALFFFRRSGDPRSLCRPEFHQRRLFHADSHSARAGIDWTARPSAPNGQIWKYCEPVGNHPADDGAACCNAPREVAPGVPESEDDAAHCRHTAPSLNDNSAVAAKREAEKSGRSIDTRRC